MGIQDPYAAPDVQDDEDEQDLSDALPAYALAGSSPLDQYGASTAGPGNSAAVQAAMEAAKKLREEVESGYASVQKQQQMQANATRDALRAARQRLMDRPPSQSQVWFNIAKALGTPTQTGTFGEALGNFGGAEAQGHELLQKEKEGREDALTKYDTTLAGYGTDTDAISPDLLQTKLGLLRLKLQQAGALDVAATRNAGHGSGSLSEIQKLEEQLNNLDPKDPNYGRVSTDLKARIRKLTNIPVTASNDPANILSDDAVDDASYVVALDPSQMRNFTSMTGGTANKTRISNRLSANLRKAGMNVGDLTAMRLRYLGEKHSLPQLYDMQNNLAAFEPLMENNGYRALDLIGRLDQGLNIGNALANPAKYHLSNADAAELRATMVPFVAEAARIINDPKMRGVISDTARGEVSSMASMNMTFGQAKRVINRLNYEAKLRQFYNSQAIKNATTGALGPGLVPTPTQPVTPDTAPPPLPPAQGGPPVVRPQPGGAAAAAPPPAPGAGPPPPPPGGATNDARARARAAALAIQQGRAQ